jgi:ABC-type nitrate/sulfonate/bicarbonate transport system substrate-binding protein
MNDNKDAVQRFADSIVLAAAKIRKDRKYAVEVMKKYFKSTDDHAMGVGVDFFRDEVLPPVQYPKAEQFTDAQTTLGKKNEKVKAVQVEKFLDASFMKSADDRGLAK